MLSCEFKFFPGQNEDDSLGDSTSDSSERLLQRGTEEGQYICDFAEGDCMQSGTFFFFFLQKFSLITRNSHHHEGI